MSHFCSNLKDISINNRNRVSNNLSNMMCIDLVTYCRIYKDSGIANISLSTNQCTFHQDIEAHILHNKWLSLYLIQLFHLKRLKILLYKKYIKYCQGIINKDLNISHIFCDNCLYNTFWGIILYIDCLINRKNILICMWDIMWLRNKCHMGFDMRNIDVRHRHWNCQKDRFLHTF